MIDPNDLLNDDRPEFEKNVIYPTSIYPVKVSIVDAGTSELKTVVNAKTGESEEKGGTPYVEISALVYEGPFAGKDGHPAAEIRRKSYVTGGLLQRFGAWCKSITRQPSDKGALARFGIVLPAQAGGEDDKDYRKRAFASLKEQFQALAPDKRLALVLEYARVKLWDGKAAIASVSVETSDPRPSDGKVFQNNVFEGFYPLDHPTKGLSYFKSTVLPQQNQWFDEMVEQGLL